MWNEAGESEEACDGALRVISKVEAKSLQPPKSPSRTKSDSLDALQQKALLQEQGFLLASVLSDSSCFELPVRQT
jgi:hypothetical protein